MPITQSRMALLIQAARAFERALESTRDMVHQAALRVQRGQADAGGELTTLESMIRPEFMIANYTLLVANLSVEERHFATHQASNDRRAEHAERVRRKRGARLQRKTTAPPMLVPSMRQNASAPQQLLARTFQPPSVWDEAQADPSMASDPESAGASAFLLGSSPSPGLTNERKAAIEAELDELEGRGGG